MAEVLGARITECDRVGPNDRGHERVHSAYSTGAPEPWVHGTLRNYRKDSVMHGVDKDTVDEALTSTFKQLHRSLMGHDNKAIESHSRALQSLISLREHLTRGDASETSP